MRESSANGQVETENKPPSNSVKFFFFFFFFFIHLSLELVGEKKQKEQAKIQFESKVRTPNQDLKISGQNQTESRFKDLLEEDIEA